MLPIPRRTVRFRRPVLHVQLGNRREKTFGRQAGLLRTKEKDVVRPRSTRGIQYGAMPRSRDPGYVRVPDTIQPYSIIAAGATSPEPSEARKAAMLWFLTFSMVDGMMPYVGSVSTPVLQFSACQTSKSVADKLSLALGGVHAQTPRRQALWRWRLQMRIGGQCVVRGGRCGRWTCGSGGTHLATLVLVGSC